MSADGRRVVRQRKVSTRVAAVTDTDRRNAANARLEALETDHDAAPIFQDSDEEFVLSESEEGELPVHDAHARFASRDSRAVQALVAEEPQLGKSRGKRKGKLTRTRKTRGMLADKQKGPKSFAVMLEEVYYSSHKAARLSISTS